MQWQHMRHVTLVTIPIVAVALATPWLFLTAKRDGTHRTQTDVSSHSAHASANSMEDAAAPQSTTPSDVQPGDSVLYDKAEKSAQRAAIDDEIDNLLEWAKVLGSAVHCDVISDVGASTLLGNRESALQNQFGPAAWVEKFVRNGEKPGMSPGGQVITNYRNSVATTKDCSGWRTNQQLVYQLRQEATVALTPP